MYKNIGEYPKNKLVVNKTKQGEPLETKIERMVNNKEPMKGEAPLIYTERKDGVQPAYDIRTDRFEIAIDASTKIAKSYNARRKEDLAKREAKTQNDGKTEPTQGESKDTTKA